MKRRKRAHIAIDGQEIGFGAAAQEPAGQDDQNAFSLNGLLPEAFEGGSERGVVRILDIVDLNTAFRQVGYSARQARAAIDIRQRLKFLVPDKQSDRLRNRLLA